MNIIKRLLNVLTIAAISVFGLSVMSAVDEYQAKIADRNANCVTLVDLERVKNGSNTNPFWKYLPRAEGKTIDEVIEETRAECSKDVDWIQRYGSAKTIFGNAVVFAIVIAILNYVVFGKATLWNRL